MTTDITLIEGMPLVITMKSFTLYNWRNFVVCFNHLRIMVDEEQVIFPWVFNEAISVLPAVQSFVMEPAHQRIRRQDMCVTLCNVGMVISGLGTFELSMVTDLKKHANQINKQ